VKRTWVEIDRWLKANAPDVSADLRPPVTAEALTALEQSLEFPVPTELQAWLAIHDGQPPGSRIFSLDGWVFLGAAEVAETHRAFRELLANGEFDEIVETTDGKAKPHWWSNDWVPFMFGGGGDYLVVDLDPTEAGTKGQVVTFCHDYGDRTVRADSLFSR